MCYLKIPKDCLVRQYKETAFGYGGMFRPNTDHYVFRLPGAEYDGYTFTVTENFGRFCDMQTSGNWYSVYVSSDDLPIVVKRTENREDGKRYKQFKFTPKELASMYGDGFRYAVAYLTKYLNNNRLSAGMVMDRVYAVGVVDGCWFLSDEFRERRRIGSKGVEIIGYIDKTNVDTVRSLFEEHKKKHGELFDALYKIDCKYNEINREIYVSDKLLAEFPDFEQINEIKRRALTELENKQKAARIEVDKEIDEFFQKLESYYTSEVA